MGMKFTPEQQRVIELHNSNILVSAAAGSGKTAVLVERIIRMICDGEHPADIDRLLIVTFTNAAAAEMRERIRIRAAPRLFTSSIFNTVQILLELVKMSLTWSVVTASSPQPKEFS